MKYVLDEGAFAPSRAHEDDAGLDLRSPVCTTVPAHGSKTIDTGVHVEIPKGTVGLILSKSGLNIRFGITSEGVIDCGYTGSIRVKLYNGSGEDYKVFVGDKISQLVITPCFFVDLEEAKSLAPTARGDKGFGSTGRK